MSNLPSPDRNGTRALLLDVAERLFAEHGFEAVSVRQLAAAVGANVAMVNYHFGTKQQLLEEIITTRLPETRERLETLSRSPLSPWEKLSLTVDMYAERFFQGRDFHRLIMREMSLRQRPTLVKIITDHLAHNLALVRGFILDGQQNGMFRPVDAELTVATVFGSFSSLISHCSLMCAILEEDCEEDIYSEKSQTRFKAHLKGILQAHLMGA